MSEQKKCIIIGGTAAGLSAASKAKRLNKNLQITVYEKSGYVSYGACGLPYLLDHTISDPNMLISLTANELKEKRDIPTYIHHEVEKICPQTKTVHVKNLKTQETWIDNYDYLVIATGGLPIIPKIQGIDSIGVFTLRTVEDGIKLVDQVNSGKKNVTIIGGGFIGLECAETLTKAGLTVTLVEALPRLFEHMPEEYSEKISQTLVNHNITLKTNVTATEILSQNNQVTGVLVDTEEVIPSDFVLVAIGSIPNSKLAENAGLILGYKKGIVVTEQMETSEPNIWACGDCVEMKDIITQNPCYVPLGTTANKQGRVVGSNIGGEKDTFSGVLFSQATKIFDLYIGATGLTQKQAESVGYKVATTSITKGDRASYYPGSQENHITLLFDHHTGRLLGAQGIGSFSVIGRINVLVTCITSGMTVRELNNLDFLYSPSIAPVYDPLLIAASQGIKQVTV